jgi:formylglycine-generating enzyme required for sulfatase activity
MQAGTLQSQWQIACSTDGVNAYPYGNVYDEGGVCNDAVQGLQGIVHPGVFSTCKTPMGLFDMVGNVAEWTNECAPGDGGVTLCTGRGGHYRETNPTYLICSDINGHDITKPQCILGIRCCAL